MASKAYLVLCASAFLVQTISSHCIGTEYNNIVRSGPPYGFGGCGHGPASFAPISPPSSGGGLSVISSSPIAPNGIHVVSENSINGDVAVVGQLPLLAAVDVESSLPTFGTAGTTYSCGNGNVGITSEAGTSYGVRPTGLGPAFAGPLPAGPGFATSLYLDGGAPFAPIPKGEFGIGTGCNGIY